MQQQVTDVIAPTRQTFESGPRLPLWLKLAWTAWIVVWMPLYWKQYGGQNFLFFCDLGNLLITLGLWLESRFIFSWQAVGLLVFQTLYVIDLTGAVLSGRHAFGGTEYMFDPHISLIIRLMGLYHCVVPPLLLWAVRRLGYDEKAWKWQAVLTAIVVPINYFWRPANNVNFARGIGHEQHTLPPWLYLTAYVVVVPVVIYWPTHLGLRRWYGKRSAG